MCVEGGRERGGEREKGRGEIESILFLGSLRLEGLQVLRNAK